MPGVQDDLEKLGLSYQLNKQDYKITIEGLGFIIFRSYDNPERIIAYEVSHSLVDEIDTLPKEKAKIVWRKISERNRQNNGGINTIGCVTTPDQGINGFVYEKWVKINADGYELIKASTRSNPYLPEGYINQILNNYDPILANLYIDGEFVSLNQSKIYHFFDREKHHTDLELKPEHKVIHVGLDFNIGGCCAIVFVIENNNPVAVDEFVSHDTQDFINNLTTFKDYTVNIYPDSSGKNTSTNASLSDIGMIKQAGFMVHYRPTNPAVRDRINAVNGLISHDRLLINTEKCIELVNALEIQGYNKKGEPEKFDEHPSIDDYNDSLGYMLAYKYPVIRQTATVESMW